MGKFFKKIYKYTPLGWQTGLYKKLGFGAPDRFMNKLVSDRSDASIIAQILAGVALPYASSYLDSLPPAYGGSGGAGTSGLAGLSKAASSGSFSWKETINFALQAAALSSSLASQQHLTGNQEEQNEFTAGESEKARIWDEEMYIKHQSMPAKVAEYNQAGLNPYTLAGGTTGFTATSPAQASASLAPNQFAEVLTGILNFKNNQDKIELERQELPSKIEANHALARLNNNNADWVAPLAQSLIDSRNADIELIRTKITTEEVQQRLAEAKISTEEANALLTWEQYVNQFIENEYADQWQQSQLGLMSAQQALLAAETAKDWKMVELLKKQYQLLRAEICETWLSAAVRAYEVPAARSAAQAAGFAADMEKFKRDHQKGDLIWSRVQTGVNTVANAAGVVIGAMQGKAALTSAAASASRANTYGKSVFSRPGFQYPADISTTYAPD